MTSALIDVPRSLDVDAWYVGAPRTQPVAASDHRDRWRAGLIEGTAAYRRQAVRECLDIIGVLRDYRPPEPGETWLTPAASERRLLTQINAIIALGADALEQVIDVSIDPDVPDAPRVFGSLLVLGCTAGSSWVEGIVEIFVRASERTTAEASAAVEACGLSPNADLDGALQALSEHENPRVRAGAVRAGAFRGTLPESHWHAAMRDRESEVVIAAMQARLGNYDRASCERALEPWYGSENAGIARFALRAGLTLRLRSARAAATDIVRRDPAWAEAATSLAMFGYLGDGKLIREVMDSPVVRSGIVAAAVLGSIELLPDLLALFCQRDGADDVRLLSAQAITTITGIPAIEANPEAVASLWKERAPSFSPRVRYRAGEPLTAELLLRVLRTPHLSRRDRQDAYVELSAMTESAVPRFSPHDFVGVQLQALATIQRWLTQGQRGSPSVPSNHG